MKFICNAIRHERLARERRGSPDSASRDGPCMAPGLPTKKIAHEPFLGDIPMRIKIMIAAAFLLLLATVLPFAGKPEANAELARDKSEQCYALAQFPTGHSTM